VNIYLKTRVVNAMLLKLLRNVNFKTSIYDLMEASLISPS